MFSLFFSKMTIFIRDNYVKINRITLHPFMAELNDVWKTETIHLCKSLLTIHKYFPK